jgi:hypothetical protein
MIIRQSDPRYQFIREVAVEFVSREFNNIPNVLFEKACEVVYNNGGCSDEVLELIDSPSRCCSYCDEEVEQGELIECNCEDDCECELDPTAPEYEDKHHWKCDSCGHTSEVEEIAWEDLAPKGSDLAWPAAWGTSFWSLSNDVRNNAAECGFLVFEPKDFSGTILCIDGAGYDFYDQHWIPLYLALGYTWHEQAEGWQEACKKRDRQLRHGLNSK